MDGMAATRSPVPELDLPERRLAVILDWLSARFGPAVVRRLREAADRDPADRVLSSGALALDRAIGTGGLPRGHCQFAA
jgi:RecA/RadA recombinase